MKNKLQMIVLAAAALMILPGTTWAQKETLGISAIKPSPSLLQSMARANKTLSLNRVTESLDSQLTDRVNATRKFEIVSRSDLKDVIKEQELAASGNVDAADKAAAKQFKLAGAKYLLVTSIDDFEDFSETATFEGTGKSATKRLIRLSAIGKIYDSTTGKLLESANFQASIKDIAENRSFSTKNAELSDELLVAIAKDMAEKIANRVADVVFPAKVLIKRDKQITINRGDGTSVQVGQVWNVFAVGEELIDPDTKESLGREEVLVGKARITNVQPKLSTAELLEDTGVDKGAVLRLPSAPPAQTPK